VRAGPADGPDRFDQTTRAHYEPARATDPNPSSPFGQNAEGPKPIRPSLRSARTPRDARQPRVATTHLASEMIRCARRQRPAYPESDIAQTRANASRGDLMSRKPSTTAIRYVCARGDSTRLSPDTMSGNSHQRPSPFLPMAKENLRFLRGTSVTKACSKSCSEHKSPLVS